MKQAFTYYELQHDLQTTIGCYSLFSKRYGQEYMYIK